MMLGALLGLVLTFAALAAASSSPAQRARASGPSARLTVLAAASLTNVFPQIDAGARYSFGGSDQLAAQILQGAPADVFAAASPTFPERLYQQGLVEKPVVFARNRLALIVPTSNPAGIESVFDLERPGIKLVVGAPTVPVGSYTRAVLQNMGLTGVLANVVSQETDVRGVLAKVVLGEADAGFAYVTDAKTASGKVRTIAVPAWAQPKQAYEIAIVRRTANRAAAAAFIAKVLSTAGQATLRRAGFLPPRGAGLAGRGGSR